MFRAGKGRCGPPWPALIVFVGVLPACCLALLVAVSVALSGCGGAQAETNPAAGRTPSLEVRAVDVERSRQAQADQLDATTLPPERSWYNQLRRDEAGNVLRDHSGKPLVVPWIVDSTPMLDLGDLSSVTNPGTDDSGKPRVVLGLNSGGQQKLGQAITAHASGAGSEVAVMTGSEVVAVIPLPEDAAAGVIFNVTAPQALAFESAYAWVGR